ncbi:SGNH/GDSL hydrolase family protein [Neolewinella persica]|uniref:SGNH/GDSL hydrolase family protein n=1 Tax=Neolewinella persica TaxID=70998 RepID=UPI0003668C74|nr:SGNH/GDSL hydrolase family protein [Neolewinella persica]
MLKFDFFAYLFCCVVLGVFSPAVHAQTPVNDTLLIDFGNRLSPGPWNNILEPAAPDTTTLTNSAGFTTTYGLSVFDPFNNINTGGTQDPDAALGFPATATGDSFFGNVTTFGGQIQLTGGVELVNLLPGKNYSLTLFASRDAADNREAQYIIEGLTSDTLYLDASDNASMVVMSTVLPSVDGRIRITASTGPGNNNAAGFYYFGAMKVVYAHEEVELPQDTILVDFGNVISPLPWNNLADPVAGTIQDMLNTAGFSSAYDINVFDAFNNINTGGTQTPDVSLGFPATATGDSFFGNVTEFGGQVQPTGGVELTELRPEKTYTLSLFASRDATDVREAQYIVEGLTRDTLYLNASDNTGTIVTTTLFPAADSTLRITAAPGPNNNNGAGFYYLGALRLNYDMEVRPPIVDTGGDTLLIDFGDNLSPIPWNNVTDPAVGMIPDLLTANNASSGISLIVLDSFNNINRNGTLSPNPSIGFPGTATGDSFFGNVAAFSGQTQPTGGIELGNMDPDIPYSFTIFASRSASDNREAQYVLEGLTLDTIYLDAASNADSVSTATLYPNAEGEIRITASPGPNNTNSSGFYYLGAIKVGYESTPIIPPFDTILVDFGGTNTSPAPWNNVTDPVAGSIEDLPNSSGFSTGYALTVVDAFNNINTAGTINPAPAIGLPATATGDSFFGNTQTFGGQSQPTGGIALESLNPEKSYTLEIFASRTAADNRETQYVIEGLTNDTLFLNASSNTDSVATTTIFPAPDGSILITASAGPNNNNASSFYYLGALKIIYEDEAPAGGTTLTLLAPNGGEFLQAGKTTPIRWESRNLARVILDYSIDAGNSWIAIDTVAGFAQEYLWTIPDSPTLEGLVRLTADTLVEISDDVFEISQDGTSCNIVVLGSSTAEGTGASSPDSSWVNRFAHLLAGDTRYKVTNLARGGFTSYHILPTGTQIPAGVNINIDLARNVTRALEEDPFAIIVNMPSNDAANNFPVADQLANFKAIAEAATSQGVRVWVATTQPRNFTNPAQIAIQRNVRDSILSIYGDFAIDFWNGLAAESGFILPEFNSGDGVHLNNAGHRLLFERVQELGIDTLNCSLTTAVDDIPGRTNPVDVRVFPNPNEGRFQVEVTTLIRGEMTLSLVDLLGRELYRTNEFVPAVDNYRISVNPGINVSNAQQLFCVITLRTVNGVQRSVIPLVFN